MVEVANIMGGKMGVQMLNFENMEKMLEIKKLVGCFPAYFRSFTKKVMVVEFFRGIAIQS